MKIIKTIICLSLISILLYPSALKVHAIETNTSYYDSEFSLSNPNEQTKIIHDGDKTIYITMGKELLPLKRETIPNGSFNRTFTYDDGMIKMTALFAGSTNPYIATVTSVSKGRYNSFIGSIFIRDSYDWGRPSYSNSLAYGHYIVDYTLLTIGGTRTHILSVNFKPGSQGTIVNVTLGTSL